MARKAARASGVAAALLLVALLVLAAAVADARPLKVSLSEEDGVVGASAVEPPPAAGIQTVVGTVERQGAGSGVKLMTVDMLGGIKDSGPSPGAGH